MHKNLNVLTRQNSQNSQKADSPSLISSSNHRENSSQQKAKMVDATILKEINSSLTEIKKTLEVQGKTLDVHGKSLESTNKEIKVIKATINGIQTEIKSINSNVESLKHQVEKVNSEIRTMNERIEILENDKAQTDAFQSTLQAEINAIHQINLANQMSIHNIPPDIDGNQAIEAFSDWSNIDLKRETFKRVSMIKNKNQTSSTLYLEFYDVQKKVQFMKFARTKQKPDKNRFLPIVAENVFDLAEENISRGVEMHFRDVFTDVNKRIFNEARRNKNILTSVWLSNQGYIMVKCESQSKPIKVLSLDHLNSIISKK